MVNSQIDKLYRYSIADAVSVGSCLPMLATDASKYPHLIKYPCIVQKKLDGVRCIAKVDLKSERKVTLFSRGGKTYPVPPTIWKQLITLSKKTGIKKFDGELYIHGLPLQSIVSAVKKPNSNTPAVKYVIFDSPDNEGDMPARYRDLYEMGNVICGHGLSSLSTLGFDLCGDEEHLHNLLDQYIEDGYEGAIVRIIEGTYLFNFRSKNLLKLKKFKDSEAPVVDVECDKNGEGVLVCLWKKEDSKMDVYPVRFKCKMIGDHDFRSYENMKKLIGQTITFKYQQTTKDGVPQFPVGKAIREVDKSGNPLE